MAFDFAGKIVLVTGGLGRMVEPAEIADAVLFLASDLARMCTGIALDVDGGVLISNDIPYEEYFARAR